MFEKLSGMTPDFLNVRKHQLILKIVHIVKGESDDCWFSLRNKTFKFIFLIVN